MSQAMVAPLDLDALCASYGTTRDDSWTDDAGIVRWRRLKWLYNAMGAATTAGKVYRVSFDGDADVNPKVVACAAIAGVYQEIAVGIDTCASAVGGWYAVEGYTEAEVNGDSTDVNKDDFLKIVAATDADAFVGNTTTRTANSHAIYSDDTAETDATPSNRLIWLLGWQAIIT